MLRAHVSRDRIVPWKSWQSADSEWIVLVERMIEKQPPDVPAEDAPWVGEEVADALDHAFPAG